ncbi:MAG: hypothetical protein Q8Q09_18885, partial [Deltaproteobacteria bacterium]|nr:hypothetical protein [Deltaproteobacteria bacterium]
MGAQLVLIDGGPMVRPVELTLGLRRARRSRAKAWRLLCAIEKADSHEALAATWQKVIAARVRK